jgi:competence protein ComEA
MAAVARRRLDLLAAELAELRDEPKEDPHDGPSGAAAGPEEGAARAAASDARSTPAGAPPASATATFPRPGRHARRPVAATDRAGGWLHDRLPPTLQGRIGLGPGHLVVVATLVAVALAVTSWWVLRADGQATLVPSAASASDSAATADAGGDHPAELLISPAPSAAAPAEGPLASPIAGGASSAAAVLVVDVAGKVRRPGIVTLDVGARVVDAIEAAGGARRGVDLTGLNLARPLTDGEQVLVGVPPVGGVAASAASAGAPAGTGGTPSALVNINTASETELEALPGVGPVTASAIVQWRTDNGAFTSVDDLVEVSGIGEKTLADLAPLVTL